MGRRPFEKPFKLYITRPGFGPLFRMKAFSSRQGLVRGFNEAVRHPLTRPGDRFEGYYMDSRIIFGEADEFRPAFEEGGTPS